MATMTSSAEEAGDRIDSTVPNPIPIPRPRTRDRSGGALPLPTPSPSPAHRPASRPRRPLLLPSLARRHLPSPTDGRRPSSPASLRRPLAAASVAASL
ncbi:hypothetical protein BRADI_1g60115v3 [Brachypodium distachyon]|nr:hypothetical protein BRADI_1g60115v3 [Brachypodium distachyon]